MPAEYLLGGEFWQIVSNAISSARKLSIDDAGDVCDRLLGILEQDAVDPDKLRGVDILLHVVQENGLIRGHTQLGQGKMEDTRIRFDQANFGRDDDKVEGVGDPPPHFKCRSKTCPGV